MAKQNFLLGRGERLPEDVLLRRGGGLKEALYTFKEAQDRLAPMVVNAAREIDDLPAEACPENEAVISLTLNPEHLAKSYYPANLLREAGIRAIGSRSKRIKPEKRSRGKEPIETVTTELFAMGSRTSIRGWNMALPEWRSDEPGADALASIEEVAAPQVHEKMIVPQEVV